MYHPPMAEKRSSTSVAAEHQYPRIDLRSHHTNLRSRLVGSKRPGYVYMYVKKFQISRSLTIGKFPISTLKRQLSYREKAGTRRSNFCSRLRKIGLVGHHRSKCSLSLSARLVSGHWKSRRLVSSNSFAFPVRPRSRFLVSQYGQRFEKKMEKEDRWKTKGTVESLRFTAVDGSAVQGHVQHCSKGEISQVPREGGFFFPRYIRDKSKSKT
jgi:hypothetical protein